MPPASPAQRLSQLIERYPEVQLATLVSEPPEGKQWVHETKYDGYRLLGFVSAGAAALRTRNGKDWTGSFPALRDALTQLRVEDAVLDMEAVIADSEGRTSFQQLQNALGAGGTPEKIAAYVFDLLYLDGNDLTRLPLISRKEHLRRLLKATPGSSLRYSEHTAGAGNELLARACGQGLEGIISKQADAPYAAGRQKSWLKSKCSKRQEFVILGYSDARTGERAMGALYLGYRKDGALRYAGKVGTGFTMQSARDLTERFHKLGNAKPALARTEMREVPSREYETIHWVMPTLLCEVAFTEWTEDGRIRHPSFQGLREDKDAREVKKEEAAPRKKSATLEVGGIGITHPDRVISETGHITKGQLAEYYAEAARLMLPRIVRRPISLLRCPSGIDGGGCFYQRNPGRGLGPHVRPFPFVHNGKKFEYLYIEDEKGLLELVQMGAIEIHPWGASIDAIDRPDRIVFDLDPAPEVPFAAVALAAMDLRKRLKKKGMDSAPKCSGGKGLHVIAPLAAKASWADVKAFAASVAHEMESDAPDAYIATMSKAKRSGRIFIDYFRNDYTATSIADYSVRARPGAAVATPVGWDELEGLQSASEFTIERVLERLRKKKVDSFSKLKPQNPRL